jgi:hypothetical protein
VSRNSSREIVDELEERLRDALASLQESLTEVAPGPLRSRSSDLVELQIRRVDRVSLHIYASEGHRRPHFHIRFKKQHSASYDLETTERIAGEMPRKYEDRVIPWAKENASILREAWERQHPGDETVVVCEEKLGS